MSNRTTEELLKDAEDIAKGSYCNDEHETYEGCYTCQEDCLSLIVELSAKLREREERIFELENALTTTRAASEFIADKYEASIDWLERKGCTVLSSHLIAMRVMLEDVFKVTEQALPTPPKKEE